MIEIEALSVKAPHMGSIAVIDVTTSSARVNLAATTQLGALCTQGKYITLQADGEDVYIFFNSADAGTVDEAELSDNDRAFCLKAGVPYSFVLNGGYTWLVHKGAAATKLRAYVSSFNGVGG